MKKRMGIVVVLVLLLTLTSCMSLFTAGGKDYKKAVEYYEEECYSDSLASLQKALDVNPELEEAIILYPAVFIEGTASYKDFIATNETINTAEAATQVYYCYYYLQELHQIAKLAGHNDLPIEDFSEAVEAAKLKAAQLQFDSAQSLEAQGDRDSLKEAVNQYLQVKALNPEFVNIDAIIEATTEKATVSIMVVGYSSTDMQFNNDLRYFFKNTMDNTKFVNYIDCSNPQGSDEEEALKNALEFAKNNNVNFCLYVKANKTFNEIRETTSVSIPHQMPAFTGEKESYGYSEQYNLDYTLYGRNDSSVINILSDSVEKEFVSPIFTISTVLAYQDIDLEFGEASNSYNYIASDASTTDISNAIYYLNKNFADANYYHSSFNCTDESKWEEYYSNLYKNFESFTKSLNNSELFYNAEVVYDRAEENFQLISTTPVENTRIKDYRVAMIDARKAVANDFINKASYSHNFSEEKTAQLQIIADTLAKIF